MQTRGRVVVTLSMEEKKMTLVCWEADSSKEWWFAVDRLCLSPFDLCGNDVAQPRSVFWGPRGSEPGQTSKEVTREAWHQKTRKQ